MMFLFPVFDDSGTLACPFARNIVEDTVLQPSHQLGASRNNGSYWVETGGDGVQFTFTHTRLSCKVKCPDILGTIENLCPPSVPVIITRDCCIEQPEMLCDQLRFQVVPGVSGQFIVQYIPDDRPSLATNITIRYRKLYNLA